jgi:uncharacterized membrane protein YraQ (UPF0718 family)
MKPKNKFSNWYFLGIIILSYVIIGIFNEEKLISSLKFLSNIIIKIIPVLIIVFIIMGITNYFINKKNILKILGKKSGLKAYSISIITGILSSGPIYMWYPLLADLRKKGMNPGLIASFLYNRAIKIPLLPIIITYFGLTFTIILSITMIIASIFQGIIVDKLIDNKNGTK